MDGSNPAGVILAGGRSRRMAGLNKALELLGGQPLLTHVIERMRPQCGPLLLSVESPDPQWQAFRLTQIADTKEGSQGPLGGLLAALEFIQGQAEWLLLVPCDAPFLPQDLAARLLEAATSAQASAALVSWQGEWQPTFSLWHTRLLPQLRAAVLREGQSGLKEFLRNCSPAILPWKEQHPSPFFNVNTLEDLAVAEQLYGSLA
jgi:molybdopterin-guanine dinucleotide biosynthesis protein A